jgi:hypothetical protein
VYRVFDINSIHYRVSNFWEIFAKPRNNDANRPRFCGFVQGKSVPWRDEVFRWVNEYKPIDAGGSLFFNLDKDNTAEGNYMQKRLMGRLATDQKITFFQKRKFAFCMENTMDMPGYVTEKIIDVAYSGSVPLYAGQFHPDDKFNPQAFINLYDYSTKDDFMNAVIGVDKDDKLCSSMMNAPLFTSYPEQFTTDGMLDTYGRMFG